MFYFAFAGFEQAFCDGALVSVHSAPLGLHPALRQRDGLPRRRGLRGLHRQRQPRAEEEGRRRSGRRVRTCSILILHDV